MFTQNEINAFKKADAYNNLVTYFYEEARQAKKDGNYELAREHRDTAFDYILQFEAMVETFNLLGLREKYEKWSAVE